MTYRAEDIPDIFSKTQSGFPALKISCPAVVYKIRNKIFDKGKETKMST